LRIVACDGGNKARFTKSTKQPLKPIARGKPADPVEPVVDLLMCFFILRMRLRVRLGIRLSLRPRLLMGANSLKLGR
jgi:hypothetical protein